MIESRFESNPPELAEAINAELDRLRIVLAARDEECEKLRTDLRETADRWFDQVMALTKEGNRRIQVLRTENAELKEANEALKRKLRVVTRGLVSPPPPGELYAAESEQPTLDMDELA